MMWRKVNYEKPSSLAEKYGVPRNTISTWLKNVDKVNDVDETSTFGLKR